MSALQQQEALRKARQAAREQARIDMHNAARQAMAAEGLSVSDLKKEAQQSVDKAVRAAVNDMVANGQLEKLIRAIVKEEISLAFGLKDHFKGIFQRVMGEEFSKLARDYINKNLSINFIEGGPNGGTF